MGTIRNICKIAALGAISALLLAGCGGGGGGGSSTAANTISGVAAKGSIGGAEVLVFKAGDYSGAADDSKALNSSSPATTDAAGRYSVNVGSYSGPVIIVVRPKAGSTMCDELTGDCTLAFDFRMRAALPSVAASTTAHITPFTEMAAKAVGVSADPSVISTANAVVRINVLAGLDPLTTKPLVDSSSTTSEQAVQRQMVVALAAVAQTGNSAITNTAGTVCNTLAVGAARIECAVDALSNTVTSSTTTDATIDAGDVAAFNTAMGELATVYVPTLSTGGSLSTTATLNAGSATETEIVTLKTLVASNSTNLGTTGTVAKTPPSTTLLSGVDQAKAFFSDLRTTLHLFSNGTNNGLLDAQATRINIDMASKIAPNVSSAVKRLQKMTSGAKLFSNSSLSIQGCIKSGSTVTCQISDNDYPFYFYNYPGMISHYVEVVMTSPSANQVAYTATAKQCTYDMDYVCSSPATDATKATGSGTLSQTVDTLGETTSATVNGTFPGSQTGAVQDKVALTANLTVPAAGSQRVDFSGSISSYGGTPAAISTTPMVTLALSSGSYVTATDTLHTKTQNFTCDAFGYCTTSYVTCTTNCTYPELSAANIILVANTPDTKFTGTLVLGSGMFDKSGTEWIPTTATFDGTMADTSTGGAGEFLTGKLELATSNYANYDVTLAESSTNYALATARFTGKIAFPSPSTLPINLVLSGSKTGFTTGTTSASFSYGSGKTISVTSAPINSTSTTNSITLTNQDGIKFTLTEGQDAIVKVGSDTVATVINNMINYKDGYVESIN